MFYVADCVLSYVQRSLILCPVQIAKFFGRQFPSLHHNNIQAVDDKEKSNLLNEFFARCWYPEPPLLEVADTTYSENVHDESQSLDDFLCTEEEVLHLLENLDMGKANGPDNISVRMLKETARSIAPSLTHLFNLSISKGKFPRLWKTVGPIPK